MIGVPEIGGVVFLLSLLALIPLSLAFLAFWIWMLVHAAQNKGLSDSERIAWVLIIALVQFLGAVIYFFVGRPKARQAIGLAPPVMTS